MFTGIIETTGRVAQIKKDGTNLVFTIESGISKELKIDQSVSHNGVCLTVTACDDRTHEVTAVNETLLKTNLGTVFPGDSVNLERCMVAGGRFDGHIVQGHVDTTGKVTAITDLNGSWQVDFEFDPACGELLVEKGSVCVNGVSLTCFNCSDGKFSVVIIPYTWSHTTFSKLQSGAQVNLEFDILGKYVRRLMGSHPVTS
ncbi:MAG: riboflavin synthase [Cyclobacteriaceae bacterium]